MKPDTCYEHAHQWIDAWNSHDLERILALYSEHVVFEAQTVVTRWDIPLGQLHGREALRRHFASGLARAPKLRFFLEQVFHAPSGYALLYSRDNGNRVIDAVELDANGCAARVTAYYAAQQL